MTDQTTCLNMAIPGVGLVPGMGIAKDSEGNLYVCKLDSAGDLYGGTDKKAPAPTPTPTSPICTGRNCMPLEIGGGGGGRPSGTPGQRPGRPVKARRMMPALERVKPDPKPFCVSLTGRLSEVSDSLDKYIHEAGSSGRLFTPPGRDRWVRLTYHEVRSVWRYTRHLAEMWADDSYDQPPDAVEAMPGLQEIVDQFLVEDCKRFREPGKARPQPAFEGANNRPTETRAPNI